MTNIQLWHSHNTRSLRPLWALEEMGLEYELKLPKFPPRYYERKFLEINPLGTVPFLVDGDTQMTESSAMCLYLAEKYKKTDFLIEKNVPEYGAFLNWLHHSDATLTFPLSLVMRYQYFESDERKNPQIVEDYTRWFLARLKLLELTLAEQEWLCGAKFTVADIAVGYALFLGQILGFDEHYSAICSDYLSRLKARSAFKRAQNLAKDQDSLSKLLVVVEND